ncbi:MAG: ribosome-associated translation inhibitor RaiA [Thermoleophilia bacterium]|nr:ribosome-associated translation inhibitor RaiA [Gaiellaceae bacterium]MDW8337604.1 ribosome-associated translation inhibitor RaiA [Thermoleophilia bacterium]
MRLEVKARHDTLSEPVRAYAEKRLGKLGRRLRPGTLVELTLSKESNPAIRDGHVAEAIIYVKGPNIVGRESAPTYEAAIDRLVETLERQIERQRDKRVLEPRRRVQRAGRQHLVGTPETGGEPGESAA